jgi:hypothetical protein
MQSLPAPLSGEKEKQKFWGVFGGKAANRRPKFLII